MAVDVNARLAQLERETCESIKPREANRSEFRSVSAFRSQRKAEPSLENERCGLGVASGVQHSASPAEVSRTPWSSLLAMPFGYLQQR